MRAILRHARLSSVDVLDFERVLTEGRALQARLADLSPVAVGGTAAAGPARVRPPVEVSIGRPASRPSGFIGRNAARPRRLIPLRRTKDRPVTRCSKQIHLRRRGEWLEFVANPLASQLTHAVFRP